MKRIITLCTIALVAILMPRAAHAQAEIEIRTPQELADIANGLNGNYRLMNDIDLEELIGTKTSFKQGYENGWIPIGTDAPPLPAPSTETNTPSKGCG